MTDSDTPHGAVEKLSLDHDGGEQALSMQPSIPPSMAEAKGKTVDEVVAEMKRMPLFMTNLDDADADGGENIELEALKALAYEGTRAEIAQNFREQGNDLAKIKRWPDAREFYDKALAALRAPRKEEEWEEIKHEESELEKEKEIAEACYANRALCNLELRMVPFRIHIPRKSHSLHIGNYRSCNIDCASALRLNPRNGKAWYRSASACLALDKLPEAEDACARGFELQQSPFVFKELEIKIRKRKEHLAEVEQNRKERIERKNAETHTLKLALAERGIRIRTTSKAPDMEDAEVKLDRPLDKSSALSIPVVLLYSVELQSDFIKAFNENETLADHLEYILPLPWDEAGEYKLNNLECYMETVSGGLIKAGKKLPLVKILSSGKVELVDGLLKVHVIPKPKATGWIEEFKKRMNS